MNHQYTFIITFTLEAARTHNLAAADRRRSAVHVVLLILRATLCSPYERLHPPLEASRHAYALCPPVSPRRSSPFEAATLHGKEVRVLAWATAKPTALRDCSIEDVGAPM